MSQRKIMEAIGYILNEDQETASAALHEFIIATSRKIYAEMEMKNLEEMELSNFVDDDIADEIESDKDEIDAEEGVLEFDNDDMSMDDAEDSLEDFDDDESLEDLAAEISKLADQLASKVSDEDFDDEDFEDSDFEDEDEDEDDFEVEDEIDLDFEDDEDTDNLDENVNLTPVKTQNTEGRFSNNKSTTAGNVKSPVRPFTKSDMGKAKGVDSKSPSEKSPAFAKQNPKKPKVMTPKNVKAAPVKGV